MKKSRFSEEQIIGVLKQHEAGVKTAELCREHGISAPTFYQWKFALLPFYPLRVGNGRCGTVTNQLEKYAAITPRPCAHSIEARLRSPRSVRSAALAKSKVVNPRQRRGSECFASTRPQPPPYRSARSTLVNGF